MSAKRSMQLRFNELLKQVGSVFKGESVNASENWLRTGLLVVTLKSPIRIIFSYFFYSLLIKVSKLVVKSISLRFGDLYIPKTKLLLFRIVNCRVRRISISEGILIINIKRNSRSNFLSLYSYNFITRYSKMIASI